MPSVTTLRKSKPTAKTTAKVTAIKNADVTRRLPLSVLMRTAREAAGKTLDDMAVASGVGKSTLWELEHEMQIDPRLSTLQKVCGAYGISIARVENHIAVV